MRDCRLLLIVFAFWVFGGCTALPQPGVEVGNPNLEGKKITLIPENRPEVFVVMFQAKNMAQVSQIEGIQTESVTVPYTLDSTSLHLQASFSDGDRIDVILGLSDAGEMVVLSFTLNGTQTPTAVEAQETPVNCKAPSASFMNQLAQALCSRIASCHSTMTCGNCESQVLTLPGLAHSLGGDPNDTLLQVDQEIAQGQSAVDQTALQQCVGQIDLLPCSTVDLGFHEGDPDPYADLKSILPKPACAPGILKDPNPKSQGKNK